MPMPLRITKGTARRGPESRCSSSLGQFTLCFVFLWSFIIGHLYGRTPSQTHKSNHGDFKLAPVIDEMHASSESDAKPTSMLEAQHTHRPGWRSIRLYPGDTDLHLQNALNTSQKQRTSWFAHKGQDKLVFGLLRKKIGGYFIDLAANEAIATSNTLALEMNANWTGLCVEPNPVYWYSLAYYRKCHVVAAVVGKHRLKEVSFRYKGMWGGIVGNEFDNRQAESESKDDSKIQFTVPLLDILQQYQAPRVIDYLNLDVEGAEEFILQHFPFSDYTFSILTVERPKDSLAALLNRSGYIFLKQIAKWGETIWAHESVFQQLDFSVLMNH